MTPKLRYPAIYFPRSDYYGYLDPIKIPQHKGYNRWFTCHRKKFGQVWFSLSKMAIGKGFGKGLDLKKKKRIGIAKSSSV
jgi:hypothetical protein